MFQSFWSHCRWITLNLGFTNLEDFLCTFDIMARGQRTMELDSWVWIGFAPQIAMCAPPPPHVAWQTAFEAEGVARAGWGGTKLIFPQTEGEVKCLPIPPPWFAPLSLSEDLLSPRSSILGNYSRKGRQDRSVLLVEVSGRFHPDATQRILAYDSFCPWLLPNT